MKITTNTSGFDSRWLRSVFCKVHAVQAKHEGRYRGWKLLKVYIKRRSGWSPTGCSGNAYVGRGPIWMRLGDEVATRTIASVFWHEMMHVYGYEHSKGLGCEPHPDHLDEVCQGLPEKPVLKQIKVAVSRDVVVTRYQHILAREAAWKKKLSRATTALQKARRERRQYEQRHGERLAA